MDLLFRQEMQLFGNNLILFAVDLDQPLDPAVQGSYQASAVIILIAEGHYLLSARIVRMVILNQFFSFYAFHFPLQ